VRKSLIISLAILTLCGLLWGQSSNPEIELRFTDGKFKIVQFTDIHFQSDSFRSDSALVLMKSVLAREKPDLVVLTGDVVTGKERRKGWSSLTRVLSEAKIPWAAMFGNHDAEGDMTKAEIIAAIIGMPYSLVRSGPDTVAGKGNYVLEIKSSRSPATAALLYCLDSQMGLPEGSELGHYQWIDFSQVAWYRGQSRYYTAQNGGKPLPALAFFHIPLPEYKEIIGLKTTVGLQHESVCSPDINTGMYAAMLECKDVMGMFVGHDHNNNYIGCLRGICLAYGNASGRQCYGDIGRGARVITLYESGRKFDTWILKLYECNREQDTWFPAADREPKFFVTYPDSFKSAH
jgi:hypothetical protein